MPTKEPVTVRYSRDVLEYFRSTGPGWQTRIDTVLKEWVAQQGHGSTRTLKRHEPTVREEAPLKKRRRLQEKAGITSALRPPEVFGPFVVDPPLELSQLLHAHLLEAALSLDEIDHRARVPFRPMFCSDRETKLSVFYLIEHDDPVSTARRPILTVS